MSLSHAQFSFGFCTKNLSSGEGGKSACKLWARNKQRLRENPKQPKPPSEYFQKTREAYKMCTNPCEKTPPNKVKRFLRLAEPLGRPSRALRAVCEQIFGGPPTYYWIEGNAPHEPRRSHKRWHGEQKGALHARLPQKQTPNSIYMRRRAAQTELKIANRSVHPSKIKGSQETRMRRPKPPKWQACELPRDPKTMQIPGWIHQIGPRNLPVASVTYSMAVTE